ncbi:MAG: hypothetical protein IJ329_00015 [Clostridia bacterium]|nr:hypothetical protein [Clostridia bacterium]
MRKSNAMKKLLAGALALSTALSIGLMAACGDDNGTPTREEQENATHNEFIEEIGGVSETYKGAVSETTYSSADAAATAYVEEEVVGDANITVVNTTSQGDLSADEVDALELDDETKDGMLGVEKIEIEYTTDETAAMSTAANNGNTKVVVYIIKYESTYKYYSPCPVTGETITKSYYNSVFDNEKYQNCTMTTTMLQKMTMTQTLNGETQDYSYDIVQTQNTKYEDGKLYAEITLNQTGNLLTLLGMPAGTQTIYLYIDNATTLVKVEQNGQAVTPSGAIVENGWITNATVETVGFNSVEELTPFYDQYLDYSYFTKTNFGFEISDENAQQYLNELYAEALQSLSSMIDQMDMYMVAKYYVSNGVLSGMRQDISLDMDASSGNESVKMGLTIVAESSVKEYGTTVVTDPTAQAE